MRPHWSLLSVMVVSAVVFPLLASCGKSDSLVRTVGCITALTGNDANYGRSTKQGLDLALNRVNASLADKGEPYRYEIVYEDDQMSPREGPSAFQKLTDINRVPLIFGPFGSKVVLAVAPLAERNKTVLISASATSDGIADAGDYIYRTVPPNRMQARDCANFALKHLAAKTAFILYVNDDYGVTLMSGFDEYYAAGGGTVVGKDAYQSQDTDFRTQLTRVKALHPGIVFFPGYYKEPALILKQAADLGLQEEGIVFVGTDGSCTDDLLRIAGPASENAYFSNLAADFNSDDPNMKAFLESFRSEYGGDPDAYAAYYFDAFMMVATVLEDVEWDGDDPAITAERIKSALDQMPAYAGITGSTQFDAKGEVSKQFAILRVENGRFELANQLESTRREDISD